MKERKNEEEINDIFTRGVGEFIDPEGIFRKKLKTNPEKIVIKFGVDPTRPDIHLGHAVVLRKLRQFQDLGCKVVFLVGDFTAMIGDPTGKSKIRPELSQKEIGLNMVTYVQQIPKILKLEPLSEEDKKKEREIIRDANSFIVDSPWFSWMRNSDWFFNVTDITPQGASAEAQEIKNEKGEIIKDKDGKSITLNLNSFPLKAAVFENTRMQKLIKKGEIKTVSLVNFLANLRLISHSQLIERDMFQERIRKGEPLLMHEMLYPVAQGIDSSLIDDIYGSCDLEVGGTDQTFNMLMGRKIMEIGQKKPQSVLSFKLLEGTDGKEKMSKSLDNYIGITDEPNDMYGKVMSIPDSSIGNYFELCTFTPMKEVEKISKGVLDGSIHPKEIKMTLARQIVSIYYGEKKAKEAEENFVKTFQKKEIPAEMEEIVGPKGEFLSEVLVKNKIVASKGEWRRLILGQAVHDLEKKQNITDPNIKIIENLTLKIGKKRFLKILAK
jgi:tyrosyl-tRNA synthetase